MTGMTDGSGKPRSGIPRFAPAESRLALLRQNRLYPLILRSRVSGVSKDEADIVASWFETAHARLLTMRGATQ